LTTKSQTKQIRKMTSKLSVTPHGGSGLGPRNRGSEESVKDEGFSTNANIR